MRKRGRTIRTRARGLAPWWRPRPTLAAETEVEILSVPEILATLDERGEVAHQPFMPEMLELAGTRARVFKRADTTCSETRCGA